MKHVFLNRQLEEIGLLDNTEIVFKPTVTPGYSQLEKWPEGIRAEEIKSSLVHHDNIDIFVADKAGNILPTSI